MADAEAALRVRKFTGDVLLALSREELAGLTCLKLRARCAEAGGCRAAEVLLVHETRQLEDSEKLEELLPEDGVLELMLVASPLPRFDAEQPAIGQLDALSWMLSSPLAEEQLTACREFRRLLSLDQDPPIDRFVEMGLVPRMVELCRASESPQLQFEAAWALTNVASGTHEQTCAIVESGGVDAFVAIMGDAEVGEDLREQAVWALGNIAGDSANLRDVVLAAGALPSVVELSMRLNGTVSLAALRNSVWAISNCCRGRPAPALESVLPALPALVAAVRHEDPEVLSDACWALSYLADVDGAGIQVVLDTGVLPNIIALMQHNSAIVQTPALRTVGTILAGEDHQTEMVIRHGGLQPLKELLGHRKRGVRKECCWAVSNITAGTKEQVRAVIDAGLLPPVLRLVDVGEPEICKEAVWALCNAAENGGREEVLSMVEQGCLAPLVGIVEGGEQRVAALALGGIKKVLLLGKMLKAEGAEAENPFVQPLLDADLEAVATTLKENLADEDDMATELEEVLSLLDLSS